MYKQEGEREKWGRKPTEKVSVQKHHPRMTFETSLKELAAHPTGQVSLTPSSEALLVTPKQTLSTILFSALEKSKFPAFSSFALWKTKYVTQGRFRGLLGERAIL